MAGGRLRGVGIGVVLALAGLVTLPGSPAGAVTGPNYTVFAATTLSLCGVHNFGDLSINSGAPGGTIRVATVASNANTTGTGPDCPAGSENELLIRADTITNHGVIDADAVQSPPFAPAPAPCDPPYQPPTGNSGGGHGFTGGHGSAGVGGSPYDVCALTIAGVSSLGLNPGAPGAGTGAGGKGGGVIVLIAHGSLVNDGRIQADGAAGTGNTTGACASAGSPNTGTAAPRGAGAGGRIVLASRSTSGAPPRVNCTPTAVQVAPAGSVPAAAGPAA